MRTCWNLRPPVLLRVPCKLLLSPQGGGGAEMAGRTDARLRPFPCMRHLAAPHMHKRGRGVDGKRQGTMRGLEFVGAMPRELAASAASASLMSLNGRAYGRAQYSCALSLLLSIDHDNLSTSRRRTMDRRGEYSCCAGLRASCRNIMLPDR